MKAWTQGLWAITAGAAVWLSLAPRDVTPSSASTVPLLPDSPTASVAPQIEMSDPARSISATGPDAAAVWILSHPAADRLAAASTLLIEFVDEPVVAANLARTLCALDSEFVREHGNTLITALTEAGCYPAAFRFAANGGPERAYWLELTVTRWACVDPRQAAEAVLAQPDPDTLPAVFAEWNKRDPAGLAEFLREQPSARSTAIHAAMKPMARLLGP